MKIFFLLLVFLFMGLVCVLFLAALPYVVETRLRLVRYGVVAFDLAAMAGMAVVPLVFPEASWRAEGLRIISMVFMAQLIFAVMVLLAVGMRGIRRWFRPEAPFDRKFRRLLQGAFVYPLAALAGGAYGGLYEKDHTVEREYSIPVESLPESLQGFRIAQLSDVHIGMFFSLERLEELLRQAATGKPDVLVITGDIFDQVEMNPAAIRVVDSFTQEFPYGIWYCHGNHEHHRGIEAIEELLAQTSIHVLVNRWETVVEGERPLVFAGADYPMMRQDDAFLAQKSAFTEKSLKGAPKDAVLVLLAHHPEFIDDGAAHGAALTLTGHTHGCQIGVFGYPLFPVFKYNRGIVQIGKSYGYVHSGNGSWFPYRLGCPPEIAYFTMKS